MIFNKLKHRWHLLPINRQLIALVYVILLCFVVALLTVDHAMLTDRILTEKQSVLANEARTLYEGLRVVEHHGDTAIQAFVDNVGDGMNTSESVGHHIEVNWNRKQYASRARKLYADPVRSISLPASDSVAGDSIAEAEEIIGTFKGPSGSVQVLERRDSVFIASQYSLLSQTLGLLTLGVIAAFATSVVLRQLVTKPIQRLVSTLQCIATGDLSVIAQTRSCQELRYLAQQINCMTRSLEHAQRDHRLHMDKARQIQQNLRPSLTKLAGVDIAEVFEPADDVGGTIMTSFIYPTIGFCCALRMLRDMAFRRRWQQRS